MSMMPAPPSIAGADGPDTAGADLGQLLDQLDAFLWSDGMITPDEERLLAAFFYKQKMKIQALAQQQQQGAGGPEQFSPQQGVPGVEEEPYSMGGAPAGPGDEEGYRP